MALKILSGGAVQRGLESAAAAFERETGHKIVLAFATAPALRRKIESREETPDLIVAPLPMMMEFESEGRILGGSSVVVGSVKAGVAVRRGAPLPDISSPEALKHELIACDAIFYTQGSSGIFVEKLVNRLGIAELARKKTIQLPDAASVMSRLVQRGAEREIGFGQVTAILLHADQGVQLVGALPKELENITTYAVGVSSNSQSPAMAEEFVYFLGTPSVKESFLGSGVDTAG